MSPNLLELSGVTSATLSRELVRWWRGQATQLSTSQALGYRTNVLSAWESGRKWPSTSVALRLARLAGRDIEALPALTSDADWGRRVPVDSREGVALLLDGLLGAATLRDLAQATGVSRHAINRYFNADAELRLPVFLALLASAGCLTDALPILAAPEELPSMKDLWDLLGAVESLHEDAPKVAEVLFALRLESYAALPRHVEGWLARLLGLSLYVELESLDLLEELGLVRFDGLRFVGTLPLPSAHADPEGALNLGHVSQHAERTPSSRTLEVMALLTCAEARQVSRIVERASEEIRFLVNQSVGADELLFLDMHLRRLSASARPQALSRRES